MLEQQGDKIRELIVELKDAYKKYYRDASKLGMTYEQIAYPYEVLETMETKFNSLDKYILKREKLMHKVEDITKEEGETTFKDRF